MTQPIRTTKMPSENQFMNMHRALQERHSLPIQRMGDIESYLRQKYDLETSDGQPLDRNQTNHGGIFQMYYLRDPALEDSMNILLHRPYCGNPFVAPGTIGSKMRRAASSQHDIELGLADEAAFFGENEETILPGQ